MPTDFDPTNLALGFLFATIGLGLLRWARKHGRVPHGVAGLVLLLAPYLCATPLATLLVCGGTLGAFGVALKLGW